MNSLLSYTVYQELIEKDHSSFTLKNLVWSRSNQGDKITIGRLLTRNTRGCLYPTGWDHAFYSPKMPWPRKQASGYVVPYSVAFHTKHLNHNASYSHFFFPFISSPTTAEATPPYFEALRPWLVPLFLWYFFSRLSLSKHTELFSPGLTWLKGRRKIDGRKEETHSLVVGRGRERDTYAFSLTNATWPYFLYVQPEEGPTTKQQQELEIMCSGLWVYFQVYLENNEERKWCVLDLLGGPGTCWILKPKRHTQDRKQFIIVSGIMTLSPNLYIKWSSMLEMNLWRNSLVGSHHIYNVLPTLKFWGPGRRYGSSIPLYVIAQE